MTFTNKQLEQRKKGIGASEAAAILGMNPFVSPLDIWLVKKGLKVVEENEAMKRGQKFEPIIAEMYQEATGLELIKSDTIYHPKYQILYATPDRIIKGQKKGLEIKNVGMNMADGWGEEGTDEIPQYHLIQCIMCMAMTDYPEWDASPLIGGEDFRIYHIDRDIELENSIIERLLKWWETYIIGNREPDIDSSHSCADYLASKYPRNFRPLKQADADTEQLIQRLAEVRYSLKSFEEQEEAIKNLLKTYIGDADGVQGQSGRCTWKITKAMKQTDYQAIYDFLHSFPEFHEFLKKHEVDSKKLVSDFTTLKPGARRFLFSPKK